MRIVLTGAAGFAGSNLTKWFAQQGHEVTGLTRQDGDLRNLASLRDLLEALQPECIVHLASNTHSGRSTADTQEHIESNIHTTANICLAAPANLKLLLLVGSIEEYGNNTPPFREEMEPSVISVYGWSKISAGALARYLCNERSLAHTWVRPSLFFGQGLPERLFFGHVLNKCIRNELVPLTPCEQTRDFLYIEDVGPMLQCLIDNPGQANGRIWNLCSGKPRRLRDVAERIQRTVGRGELAFGALPYREHEVMNFYSDPQHFIRTFSPPPQTPFDIAVAETVKHSLAHEEAIRVQRHLDLPDTSRGSCVAPVEVSDGNYRKSS